MNDTADACNYHVRQHYDSLHAVSVGLSLESQVNFKTMIMRKAQKSCESVDRYQLALRWPTTPEITPLSNYFSST